MQYVKTISHPSLNGYKLPTIDMSVSYSNVGSSSDPNISGPSMWFTFHNSTLTYPKNPTSFIKSGMKQLLQNIHLMIGCLTCKEHFYTFMRDIDLEWAVSSRDNLFEFWVNAHNYVNERLGKSIMSLTDAKYLYGFDNPSKGAMMRISYMESKQH